MDSYQKEKEQKKLL
jgi:hypothetical protein